MPTFIAGKDAGKFDKSDWDIEEIPVYLNAQNLPISTGIEQAEDMIRAACFSWSLRYSHTLKYVGITFSKQMSGGVVINYNTTEQLMQWYGKEVNGLCKYHMKHYHQTLGKWIMDSCEIYINADNRPLPNRFARATIKHELGHACGIHGHNDHWGSVMYTSSMGHDRLTLHDCQMLDEWDPYPVELHPDMGMSVPAVNMQDGRVVWFELNYTGSQFIHSWLLGKGQEWNGPKLDNVVLGEVKEFQTQPCQYVRMKKVKSLTLDVRADFLLAPNGTLILEYAE
ncbi:MAG: hypothetical protein CMK70_13420 [Pseudohongiella sp.]|nr:hypothetical protein [Pseudohongiella sp.]|tara:strand:+ start:34524 stop:35369 length:846 start_codon:yes stop_codon:yes gene_type:complete